MSTLVIDDVDETLLKDSTRLAERNCLTVEEQAKLLLRQSFPIRDRSALVERAQAIAAMTPKGVVQTDSVLLLREDRDR